LILSLEYSDEKYDDEYKQAAVKKIHDGQSVATWQPSLGVAESLLHNWKRQTVEASFRHRQRGARFAKEVA
jgi:transposase-like protein